MANLRQIRSRIRSVQSTQKITRAMQMVAGAKLRRAQEQLFQTRPYVDRLEKIVQRFLAASPTVTHPVLTAPTVEEGLTPPPIALVLITSDTGLCGSYNERLLAAARQVVAETRATLVPIGRKGLAAVRRMGWSVLTQRTELGGAVPAAFVQSLAQSLLAAYQAGQISGVRVLYTAFQSALSWRPTVATWLPLAAPAGAVATELTPADLPVIYEPTPSAIAEQLLPAYLTARLRRLLLESMTSEHSARMLAMKAATDNAAEMIDSLTLIRNKVRQAAITKEISEIVAGAEALTT